MSFREGPWQIDPFTLREEGELLCYSGNETGRFIWQKGSTISSGEFARPGGWKAPIHLASFYATAEHQCGSPEEAQAKAVERAGFRKPFYISEGGWREHNSRMSQALEAYDGLDPFLLSMRSRVWFYGGLSDGQTKALRRMIWKLKAYMPD